MAARITGKQRAARKRNIKIAQRASKKGVTKGRGMKGKAFRKAFKKEFKEQRRTGSSKAYAKRAAFKAAGKKAPGIAKKKAGAFARGIAKKFGVSSKSGQRQFAAGYKKSIFG